MAISSPSGTQATAVNPGDKPPRWRPFWRLVWRIAVTAILGAIGAAAGFYTEALLKDLPELPKQMRDAPGVVRIVVIAVVAIVILLVIASYFWGKKADEDEEDTISPKLDTLTRSDEAIKKNTEEANVRLIRIE